MQEGVSDGIHYLRNTGDGTPVVLLHGWGGSTASFRGTFDFLSAFGRETLLIDFPGFGDSPPPPPDWGIYEYARAVVALTETLGYSRFIPVGHSFGGRVSIILGKLDAVEKLVLVDAAGMKPRRGLRYYWKVGTFKLKRKLGLNPSGGSADYRALDETMRSVFKRVVNTFLEPELAYIDCPTLLVWGKDDRDTPLYMARRIEKAVKDCALITLHGGHYAYVDNMPTFHRILEAFL